MGGLVIKKMYIIARQNKLYEAVARRIRAIYFVATPHSGSLSSELLLGLFHAAFGSRSYVTDLEQGSAAIQYINQRFCLYSKDIDLWSFYETLPLTIGPLSKMIVRKDSATLGYREENQVPLTADHRSICKFSTPDDPNYKVLRNALALAVQTLDRMRLESKKILRRDQITDLEKYLGVSAAPHGDLLTAQDARLAGTCLWLSMKKSFLQWRDFLPNSPSIFWLNGNPGTGKSVLAGYVIDHLKQRGSDVSYFFFKYGDDSKSKLSACLRSIAFQMARNNMQALDLLLQMESDGMGFDHGDERTIWMQIFMSGLFQAGFSNHYWIIDALDECVDFVSFFVPMLAKLDKTIPLRVLITSRTSAELQKQFSNLGVERFLSQRISAEDTLPDIKLLLEGKSHLLAGKDDKFRAALVDNILSKSNDSFLWTTLVLHQLRNAHSMEEVGSILEDVPREMEPLYMRALQSISRDKYGRDLAKAVLDWTICAVRPLTVRELEAALKLGQNTDFLDLAQSITNVCGQLVNVDKLGRVQMVHTTARQFLADENLESEFAVKKTEVHTRITKVCLTYLTSKEVEPTGSRNTDFTSFLRTKRNAFAAYSFESFSDHLVRSNPLAEEVFGLLNTFLNRNILSWIQVVAETQNLTPLFHVGKNLGRYLNIISESGHYNDNELRTVRGWKRDLMRVVAKYGDVLLTSPSAIHQIIVPFCPKESTVYKTNTRDTWLSVVGKYTSQWDDSSRCMGFNDKIVCMSQGDEYFAIRFEKGPLVLYHGMTYQEHKVLDVDRTCHYLQFQPNSDLMASYSGEVNPGLHGRVPYEVIKIWNIRSGEIVYNFDIGCQPSWIEFCGDLLVVVSKECHILTWDLLDGSQRSRASLHDTIEHEPSRSGAKLISICPGTNLLAFCCGKPPISLWNVEQNRYYGSCGKQIYSESHTPCALVFNPNPAINLLAVSYDSGEIVILQPETDQMIARCDAVKSSSLAVSPDGRILLSKYMASVSIYEFATLRFLHIVTSESMDGFGHPALIFGNDSLHFFAVSDCEYRVWEPAILFREDANDGKRELASLPTRDIRQLKPTVEIDTIAFSETCDYAFCGNNDGSVTVFDLETGLRVEDFLYQLQRTTVTALSWSPDDNCLIGVYMQPSDAHSAWLISLKLEKHLGKGWILGSRRFAQQLPAEDGYRYIQLLTGPCGKSLISAANGAYLFNADGQLQATKNFGPMRWVQHPSSPLHVLSIDDVTINIFPWSDLTLVTSIHIDVDLLRSALFPPAFLGISGHNIVAEAVTERPKRQSEIYCFDSSFLDLENLSSGLLPTSRIRPVITSIALAGAVFYVLGVWKSRVIFCDHNSWICSVDPEDFDGFYLRHFYVPKDWLEINYFWTKSAVTRAGHIIFFRGNELVVIKGWSGYGERVEVLRSSSSSLCSFVSASSFVSAVEEQGGW
ncbi:hypothetical protein FQN50_004688 [Emmonsiellopsis sp. PD_5]|nr:hypothetical protein FQN50_004688 [Emmonsiellopsis sp. PD_5]